MATIIAAAVARARRDIQHYFFSRDAVQADRAVRFEPNNRLESRQFHRMIASGVIREAKPGTYWIDLPAYDSEMRARFAMLRSVLLAIIVLVFVGIAIGIIR